MCESIVGRGAAVLAAGGTMSRGARLDGASSSVESWRIASTIVRLAVLFTACASGIFLQWARPYAPNEHLRQNHAQRLQAPGESGQQTERQSVTLEVQNVPLRVQNAGNRPLRIRWVGAVHVDREGTFKKFDSAFVGYPEWTLPPGGSVQLEHVDGATVVWNGDALFYSLDVQVGDNEYNIFGSTKDFVDGTLKLRLE